MQTYPVHLPLSFVIKLFEFDAEVPHGIPAPVEFFDCGAAQFPISEPEHINALPQPVRKIFTTW